MPLLTTQSARSYGFSKYLSGNENFELISTGTLTSAASGILFDNLNASNITAKYKHLRLIGGVIEDISGNNSWIQARINGDTGSNYYYVGIRSNNGASLTTSSGVIDRGLTICATPTRISNNTIYPAVFYADIPMFASTDRKKSMTSIGGSHQQTDDAALNAWYTTWNSTAAITSIFIRPDTGLNFKANSSVSLYGLKG